MRRPRAHVMLPVVLVLICVASCSHSSGSHHRSIAGSAAASRTSAPSVTTTLQQNPLPAKLPKNDPAARKDVVQTKCAAIRGGWGASGYVKNSARATRVYQIMVFFTTTQATTLDYAKTSVTVGAGKTVDWSATKKFAAQPKMLCPMPSISAG